jgi:hypothetical protein
MGWAEFCAILEDIPDTSVVDVMITIFCDSIQFSAKKLAFFLKNERYDQIFA